MSARESRESYAYLNAGRVSYLEKQMDVVSRSFAVVVSCLEQPCAHLSTAYLLSRGG
jgi:hypothetical protein